MVCTAPWYISNFMLVLYCITNPMAPPILKKVTIFLPDFKKKRKFLS